jgi:hypothetical protein
VTGTSGAESEGQIRARIVGLHERAVAEGWVGVHLDLEALTEPDRERWLDAVERLAFPAAQPTDILVSTGDDPARQLAPLRLDPESAEQAAVLRGGER